MVYLILSIILGLIVGIYTPINISTNYSVYIAVLVLALLSYITSSIKSQMEAKNYGKVELIGFAAEMVLALLFTFISEQLGIPLYYAPIFYFGVNIFENFKKIIIYLLKR